MKIVNLKTIRIDGGTQSRVSLNEAAVADYAEHIRAGGDLPPVVVFSDGSDHWLADGFHRFHAYSQAGKASIPADVRNGARRDAVLYAAGANAEHGLRRTNEDKRRAVQMLLDDAECAKWSDRQIAKHCGVTQPFVSGIRKPKVITVITPPPAPKAGKVESDSTQPAPKVATVTTPPPATKAAAVSPEPATPGASAAHDDVDPIKEWERTQRELEKAEAVIQAMQSDDTKAELAKQIRIRQGIEVRLSDEMEKNKQLQKLADGYGKWFAELRKVTGLQDRAAITRFCKEAKQSKESAL